MMRKLGSRNFSLWLHDGTNSPGQLSLFEQSRLLEESLRRALRGPRAAISRSSSSTSFLSRDFTPRPSPIGGGRTLLRRNLGDRAKVLVDLGHHPLGTNIEQVVANLQGLGKLGGFHFNDKKYADDDLATGSVDPFQLFRIFNVLVEADLAGLQSIDDVAFMIDESHCLKDPLEEMIEAVDNIQRAYVLALCVDRQGLKDAQKKVDAELGDQILKNAFFDTPANAIVQTAAWRGATRSIPSKNIGPCAADGTANPRAGSANAHGGSLGQSRSRLADVLRHRSRRVQRASHDCANRWTQIQIETAHRFPNHSTRISGHLYWDLPRILDEIKAGIRKGFEACPPVQVVCHRYLGHGLRPGDARRKPGGTSAMQSRFLYRRCDGPRARGDSG